jgi:hypothetical protein
LAKSRQSIQPPVFRPLRVFAVDPGTTAVFETAVLNEEMVRIPWEELKPGPEGEYVAIVDVDETGSRLHGPQVDLDRPEVLAEHGLAPSDGDPHFRQQMLYAVAMRTITNFERALGRRVHWAPQNGAYQNKIKLFPHYTTMENAYWDRAGGGYFGYFPGRDDTPFAKTVVFTCLSQDVIAHNVTHALLTGLNAEFKPGAHHDTEALHEAFADLVALFQHFSETDVLRERIAAIRGDLDRQSQLGAVAPQFGQAMGLRDGIRNALGSTDKHGVWHPRLPDPNLYETELESHERGDLLVAAVFLAFKEIYNSRVADLRRIATRGTGVLQEGSLHPDLVNRFTHEAAISARHVLEMCMRALDYMPPTDVTFGDVLRAIVTADYDLVPNDDRRYRIAFAEAFRAYGLAPSDPPTLSVDTLRWNGSPLGTADALAGFIRDLTEQQSFWTLPRDREALWDVLRKWRGDLEGYLRERAKTEPRLGPVDLTQPFDVVSFDLRERRSATRDFSLLWIVKLVQAAAELRSGLTLVIDAETGLIRYQIEKTAQAGAEELLLERADSGRDSLPAERPLRVFAFDPSLSVELDTAQINEVAVAIPWERDRRGRELLAAGPVGEYVEVVDHDPASGCFYEPVDLTDPLILVQDGLTPSESNPQFHQQMVYAVTMRTIRNFERALGRLALWSPRHEHVRGHWVDEYVQRLRIHPHALREANAYYSPVKKALLFGYFPAATDEGSSAPAATVFTCLSHDIVAHEATHALLDGIHRRFNEPSNPDVLAFHEAFADIVALFQHFSLPDVLRHQIAETRGDLASQNRLGELAQQFGQAIGKRGALRSAIGAEPDPTAYARLKEPHDRGSLLVAAVFDAFLTIYKARIADLLRIASEGTGVLPEGQLHPDLVNRLAEEAAESAQHVLEMCIRALDYCPPVDITFGDYLRALVTADFEFNPVDEQHHRIAFAEAFRRWGLVPENVRTLSVDGLLWRPTAAAPDENKDVILAFVKRWAGDIGSWNLTRSRRELYELMERKRAALHRYLKPKIDQAVLNGIDPRIDFEVHSIRPSLRTEWNGWSRLQWVIELTQREAQWYDGQARRNGATADYYFRGGCTLIVDAETGEVRYSIKKRLDTERRERQRSFVLGDEGFAATYFRKERSEEQFAALHRVAEVVETS